VDQAGRTVPLPENEDFYPITLGKPLIGEVLGIDLASHPEQGNYLRKATSSKTAVATPPVSLIEHDADKRSLIAFAPHHSQDDSDPPTCRGIAVLILEINPVVETAMQDWQSEKFQVAIIDKDEDPDEIIYKNFPGDSISLPRADWPVELLQIRFADQQWLFQVAPTSLSQFSNPPYWILLTGLALSALVANSLSAGLLIGGLRKQVDAALELGQYRLGKKLGEGGMGIVYEADHCMLARPAAIKLIQLDEKDDDPESVSQRSLKLNRFEKEAQATAQLESPHTIKIYDFGRVPDGRFYYVMELLHGTDLSTLVKDSGPIAPARMIHLVRQACRSLAEAHAADLIHRDIKPANIFVCRYAGEYDFVKVLDFGLVKSSGATGDLDITRPGSFIGTPAFVAPEMLLEKDVDGRTDLYSLGCVMYWLLTGRPPFTASTATAMMAKHLTEQPTSLRALLGDKISIRLDEIVLSCLAKKPENRPQSAVEVERSLAACATEAPWTQAQAKVCWERERGKKSAPEPESALPEP
jgi:serine/threonine protein kinase